MFTTYHGWNRSSILKEWIDIICPIINTSTKIKMGCRNGNILSKYKV